MSLSGKSLTTISNLTVADINLILDTARSFEAVSARNIKKVPTLRGRTIINLFLEPSTRTRTSFELAGKRLSADVVNISYSASALSKGECFKDTAKTIESMIADAVIIRHKSSGAAQYLASLIEPVVINAGDGWHEHPTQALLDLYTIRKTFNTIKNVRVAIVGDIAHSRVARSLILALNKLKAKVVLVAPYPLLPMGVEKLGAEISTSLDDIMGDVDIVYLLRIQKERIEKNCLPSLREYSRLYGLNKDRWRRVKDRVKVMHPGPLNRGIEIDAAVADSDSALITTQVNSGVAVRMAVLYLLLESRPKSNGGRSIKRMWP